MILFHSYNTPKYPKRYHKCIRLSIKNVKDFCSRFFLSAFCRQSMSAFDFNRYRTVEDPTTSITARDLQKARRSAARSTIKKSKYPQNPQKHFNQHQACKKHLHQPTIEDEMPFGPSLSCNTRPSASSIGRSRLDDDSDGEINADLQAGMVSAMSNSPSGHPQHNPASDSFISSLHVAGSCLPAFDQSAGAPHAILRPIRSSASAFDRSADAHHAILRPISNAYHLSTDVHALRMQSYAPSVQHAALARNSTPLSFYFANSPSLSIMPPLLPRPQFQSLQQQQHFMPPPQQHLLLPSLQQHPGFLLPLSEPNPSVLAQAQLAIALAGSTSSALQPLTPVPLPGPSPESGGGAPRSIYSLHGAARDSAVPAPRTSRRGLGGSLDAGRDRSRDHAARHISGSRPGLGAALSAGGARFRTRSQQ